MRSITIKKGRKALTFNEVEAVRFVAQFLEVSEYEVFQMAFNDWYGKRMDNRTMDYRFENYLDEDIVPYWVWLFTKDVIEKYETDQVDPAVYGIEPMVLTRSQKNIGWLIIIGISIFALLYCWVAINFQP